MKSFQIINGDIAIDSRGKAVITEGNQKVSNQINYYLSVSPYIQNLFLPNGGQKPSSNEAAVREAITKTLNSVINQHAQISSLPANECLVSISELQVISVSKTSFAFTVKLKTKANEYTLKINRG